MNSLPSSTGRKTRALAHRKRPCSRAIPRRLGGESLGAESPYESTKLVHVSLEDGPGHPLSTGTTPEISTQMTTCIIIVQRRIVMVFWFWGE